MQQPNVAIERLMGFRLLGRTEEERAELASALKDGGVAGAKIGNKVGGKLGVKEGTKGGGDPL